MQKNEFEAMVKELLPDVTAQAMEKWTQYAQELEQDGTEKQSDLYDAAYVELQLVKEHQGEPTAASLFNYGEQFVFNYFELRGAAAKLTEGWTLEQIRDYTIENGCDPHRRGIPGIRTGAAGVPQPAGAYIFRRDVLVICFVLRRFFVASSE